MSLRRSVSALAAAAAIGTCAVGVSVATADDPDSAGHSESDDSGRPPTADRIALDAIGDAGRGVDIQSLAVFNRPELDFVALSITGRDFRVRTTRSVEIFLDTTPRTNGPDHRIVAFNRARDGGAGKARIYRVKGWSTDGQKRISCEQLRVQFDIETQSQIRMAVPRGCLRSADGPLSANASVWEQHPVRWSKRPDPGHDTDVAPEEEMLTPAS